MRTIKVPNSILIAFLVLALGLFFPRWGVGPASAGSRRPAGDSPADALGELCSWQSLSPASHAWYRVPPGDDKELTVRLVSYPRYIDGMGFQVYGKLVEAGTESAISNIIGVSQKTNSRVVLQWVGEALVSYNYYVDVLNDNPFAVGYSLCHHASESSLLTSWE